MRPRSEAGLIRLLLLLVLAAIGLGVFGIYWYFIRDDAPPAATVPDRPTVAPASGGPDGKYHVTAGASTFAGFRMPEHYGPLSRTAVVRTTKVSGTMTLSGTKVTSTNVRVDLTALESLDSQPPGVPDIANRVGFLRHSSLETSSFPSTTFHLSKPITLPATPAVGVKVSVPATGTLTLHGVAKTVTIPLTARWNGAVIDVSGSLPVALADFQITRPSLPFVSVDAAGSLEFELELSK